MVAVHSLPENMLAISILFLLLALSLKYAYRLFWSPLSGFPGPRFAACSKLFEAYHILLKDDWIETLESLHRQHGPVVRISPNELHFNDHEFCLRHHKRSDLYKCNTYYGILSYLLGGFADPRLHTERKSIIQPLFGGQTLSDFSDSFMNSHIQSLIQRLGANSTEVNATYIIWAYTTDVMMSYVTGQDYGYLKSDDLKAVHDTTRAFSAIDLATVLRSMPLVKMAFDCFPQLRSFSPLGWIDRAIHIHLKAIIHPSGDTQKTVLSRIWHQLPDERVATHETSQAVFIGNESLLSNISVLLHHVIRNPDCVRKLRAELDTLDVDPTHGVWCDRRVLQLKYLDAVCRESTRMSAPGWHRQPRQALEPVEYGGTVIPAKTSMSFTLKLLEHDPALYPNPLVFNPDRWLDEEAETARRSSVTFGTGTRTCLGQFIARRVLRKTLAALVYHFDMSFVHEEKDRQEGYKYLNTYPKKGCEGYLMIRLEPRFLCENGKVE